MDVDWDLLSHLVPMTTTCLSACCSTLLLCRLRRLPAVRRKRLLVRQLTHMGAANLLYAFPELLHLLAAAMMMQGGLLHDLIPPQMKSRICVGTYGIFNVGAWVFLLLDTHLAVTFAASISGSARAMRLAYAWLAYVWPVGTLLSLFDLWDLDDTWNVELQRCTWSGLIAEGDDFLFAIFGVIVFTFCLSTYVVSTVRVRLSGHAVQSSVWRRACQYPAVALLTLAPEVFYCVFRSHLEGVSRVIAFTICTTLYNASGLLTYAVYASQSRYVRLSASDAAPEAFRHHDSQGQAGIKPSDFRVSFRDTDTIVVLAGASDGLSFEVDPEMAEIPSIQAAGSTGLPQLIDDVALMLSYFEGALEGCTDEG